MAAATSERGLLVIDAVAEGVSGHAARNEGINAIGIAVDDITKLHGHVFHKSIHVNGPSKYECNADKCRSRHTMSSPDRCEFVIDIRPTERYSNKEILNELQSICKSRLTARNLHNRSSATRQNPLLECVKSMGISTFHHRPHPTGCGSTVRQ